MFAVQLDCENYVKLLSLSIHCTRVSWIIFTRYRSSIRQVAVYDAKNLAEQLGKVDLDTSPAILVPHYDEDSSTLFVTGRVSLVHFVLQLHSVYNIWCLLPGVSLFWRIVTVVIQKGDLTR